MKEAPGLILVFRALKISFTSLESARLCGYAWRSPRFPYILCKYLADCWKALANGCALSLFSYNSAIFSATAAYSYTVFAGPSSLGIPAAGDTTIGLADEADADTFDWLHYCAQNGTLAMLDAYECISAYRTTYKAKYGSLILATHIDSEFGYEVVGTHEVYEPGGTDPYAWLCPANKWGYPCDTYIDINYSEEGPNNWVVDGENDTYTVKSCLTAPAPEHCKLQYSLPLTMIVIGANVIKASILCYMAVTTTELPILTIGDAVASFLQQPDRRTMGRCLMSAVRVRVLYFVNTVSNRRHWPYIYKKQPKRWYTVISRTLRVGLVIL